jgi:hypothetical protein
MIQQTTIAPLASSRSMKLSKGRKLPKQISELRLIDDLLEYTSCIIDTTEQLARKPECECIYRELKSVRDLAGRLESSVTAITRQNRSHALLSGAVECLGAPSEAFRGLYASEMVAVLEVVARMAMPALRPSEVRMLIYLVRTTGEIASPELLAQIAGSRAATTRHVKVQISRIRSNLGTLDLLEPIETCTGGYRFRAQCFPLLLASFARITRVLPQNA